MRKRGRLTIVTVLPLSRLGLTRMHSLTRADSVASAEVVHLEREEQPEDSVSVVHSEGAPQICSSNYSHSSIQAEVDPEIQSFPKAPMSRSP